jgi:hypothetical protein
MVSSTCVVCCLRALRVSGAYIVRLTDIAVKRTRALGKSSWNEAQLLLYRPGGTTATLHGTQRVIRSMNRRKINFVPGILETGGSLLENPTHMHQHHSRYRTSWLHWCKDLQEANCAHSTWLDQVSEWRCTNPLGANVWHCRSLGQMMVELT